MNGFQIDPRLKIVLVGGGGLVFAVLAGFSIGQNDYRLLIIGGLFLAVLVLWFATGQMFWVLTVASSFLTGTFPVLGGQFTPFHILMAIGVVKFMVEEIVFRHRKLARLERVDLLLLAGFMLVLTFHALKDRFGMRFLGSSVWGGRNYVNVYVSLAAFFIIQTVSVKEKVWAKLPYVILAITSFDLIIAIITTVFPSSIYRIFPFYSAVSTAGIAEIFNEEGAATVRVGGFGNFGLAVITIVLASVSLRYLFSPRYLGRLITFLAGWAALLYSSFRSAVVNGLLATLLAGIRDLRWGVVPLLPIVAAGLFGLSILNSYVRLPKPVQRSLSFMPGDWDPEMRRDAAASNDFRQRIWTVWKNEYFPVHPWFGRGFGFRSEAATRSVFEYDPYADKLMVEVGNIHNGFYATVDALGIVGTLFFIGWNLRLFARTLFAGAGAKDESSFPLRFVALNLGALILAYWVGAYTVGSFLPQEFALAGVFLRLRKPVETCSRSRQEEEYHLATS